jgi:hypothetical protein
MDQEKNLFFTRYLLNGRGIIFFGYVPGVHLRNRGIFESAQASQAHSSFVNSPIALLLPDNSVYCARQKITSRVKFLPLE